MIHSFFLYLNDNWSWISFIIMGMSSTIFCCILSIAIGFFIAAMIAIARLSKNALLSCIAEAYISLIRGTPLILQLSIAYYMLPSLIGVSVSPFAASVIALSVNSGAYVAEIIRGGINSVDKGQFEAAESLSIPYWSMMKDIIMPQAFRKIIPSLGNEMINLIKESAIVGIVGEVDIMRRAQLISAERYVYFGPLLVAGCSYYCLSLVFSRFSKYLEKKLSFRGNR